MNDLANKHDYETISLKERIEKKMKELREKEFIQSRITMPKSSFDTWSKLAQLFELSEENLLDTFLNIDDWGYRIAEIFPDFHTDTLGEVKMIKRTKKILRGTNNKLRIIARKNNVTRDIALEASLRFIKNNDNDLESKRKLVLGNYLHSLQQSIININSCIEQLSLNGGSDKNELTDNISMRLEETKLAFRKICNICQNRDLLYPKNDWVTDYFNPQNENLKPKRVKSIGE